MCNWTLIPDGADSVTDLVSVIFVHHFISKWNDDFLIRGDSMLTKLEKRILKSAYNRNHTPPSAWIKLDEIVLDIPNAPYATICCACCSLRTSGYLDECIGCLDGNMVIHLSQRRTLASHRKKS